LSKIEKIVTNGGKKWLWLGKDFGEGEGLELEGGKRSSGSERGNWLSRKKPKLCGWHTRGG